MTAFSSEELKQLQTRLSKAKAKLKSKRDELHEVQREVNERLAVVDELKQEIHLLQMKQATPTVTEHAILRYISRVLGIDLDEIRDRILTESVVKQIQTLGNGTYPVESKDEKGNRRYPFKVKVKNNTIVSVWT